MFQDLRKSTTKYVTFIVSQLIGIRLELAYL